MNEENAAGDYILSLSYGKDSMAAIHVITEILKKPLTRIITADIWATDTIPADVPPMVEFKTYADEEIKRRYGLTVEHISAKRKDGSRRTFENTLLQIVQKSKKGHNGEFLGWPTTHGRWCTSYLKTNTIDEITKISPLCKIQYLGIAADETQRIERYQKRVGFCLPLVEAGWDEAACRKWCADNKLLSPIYSTSARGGCFFCPLQSTEQLRILKKQYPALFEIMLKWDAASPITFKGCGRTLHDYAKRFDMEETGLLRPNDRDFRWEQVTDDRAQIQLKLF